MADITFFDGFTMTWSQDGTHASISQDAFKAGWSFIGDTPPAREQFNTVHYLDGLRQQWLYGQLKGVTDAAGLTLVADDTGTLWAAISAKLDTKVGTGITLSAGVGLSGGGSLSESRTVSMGTPSDISSSTANSASGTTHSHALTATGVTAGSYGSKSQIPAFTVDAKGRATAASTNKVSVGDVQDVLAVANGGTGASEVGDARENLGMSLFLKALSFVSGATGSILIGTDDGTKKFLLQWGTGTLPSGSKTTSVAITFNTPFGECWHVNPVASTSGVTSVGFNAVLCYTAKSSTGATIQGDVNEASNDYPFNKDVPFTYFAFGSAP